MASSVVFINIITRIKCFYRKNERFPSAATPSLNLQRLQSSILSQLNVSSDMSIDATALEKLLGKTNRSYEESVQGMSYMKQLCTTHDLNKAAFSSSGKRDVASWTCLN